MRYAGPTVAALLSILVWGGACACGLSPAGDALMAGSGGGGGAAAVSSGGTSGVLTAGVWDDNLNFDFYLGYLRETRETDIPRSDRVIVRVVDATGQPVPGARIAPADFPSSPRGVTGAEGTVVLHAQWDGLRPAAELELLATTPSATGTARVQDGRAEIVLATGETLEGLDVALVLDATGSMGDEIQWLQAEFATVLGRLAGRYPTLEVRVGGVVYRDRADPVTVRTLPFTSDFSSFQSALAEFGASGGGDYPEAMELALQKANGLDWSPGPRGRVIFVVADAPPHLEDESELFGQMDLARGSGRHLYPVAASGVDAHTEHLMRTMAQMSGGRYVFLTDDSGIGGDHLEPTVPCYVVTLLERALERVLEIEVTGRYQAAAAEDILRVGGAPEDGHCSLDGGRTVELY